MKIRARGIDGKIFTIVNVQVVLENHCDLAITVDKYGKLEVCDIGKLTIIDEEYLPKESEDTE
jgi:hypothetical protein